MIVTLLVFLIILSILIFAHEFGHFLAAKKAGIRVEEFGFGYPPRVWSKKVGQTIYSVNLLPFGGFVKLLGEEGPEEGEKEKKGAFWTKSKRVRTAVIVSGVLANFLLAVVAFSIVYSAVGIPTETLEVQVVGIAPGSPAEEAGLKEEDVIVKVEEEKIEEIDEFVGIVNQNKGKEITLQVEREEEGRLAFLLTPRETPPEGEGALGVAISNIKMVHYPVWQMPFRGAAEGFREAFGWTVLVVGGLGGMIYRLVTTGALPADVAGPVGILQLTSGVAKSGILTVLQFLGVLSVNLAVINIFPFPALDGGRLLFVGFEAVTGRRAHATFERWVHTVGMIILLFLILLVTLNDISRALEASQIGAQLRSLWPF